MLLWADLKRKLATDRQVGRPVLRIGPCVRGDRLLRTCNRTALAARPRLPRGRRWEHRTHRQSVFPERHCGNGDRESRPGAALRSPNVSSPAPVRNKSPRAQRRARQLATSPPVRSRQRTRGAATARGPASARARPARAWRSPRLAASAPGARRVAAGAAAPHRHPARVQLCQKERGLGARCRYRSARWSSGKNLPFGPARGCFVPALTGA